MAVVHFNANLKREVKLKNGEKQITLLYPKFKNGVAIVRETKVTQHFGM